MSTAKLVEEEVEVIDLSKEDEIIERAMLEQSAKEMGGEYEAPETDAEESNTETEQQTEAEPEAKSEEPEQPSLESQVRELFEENKKLRKALETTNGRYGNELHELRQKVSTVNANPNLREAFKNLSIDNPAFKDLKDEFPEITEKFINGFRSALVGNDSVEQQLAIQQEVIDTAAPQRQAEIPVEYQQNDRALKALAMNRLSTDHPDFESVAGFKSKELAGGVVSIEWKDQEFGKWIESMPEEVREAILIGGSDTNPSADKVMQIADILTEYKRTAKPQTEPTENKKPSYKPDLKRALLPDGRQQTKNIAMTEDEIIEAAKRRTMKQVMTGLG